MNNKELGRYKKILTTLQERYLKERKSMEEDYLHNSQRDAAGDLSAYTVHIADIASDSYERDKIAELADNINNILYEIQEALYRLESGEYGICEICRNEISKERLDAMPYVRTCITCQRMKEKEDKEK